MSKYSPENDEGVLKAIMDRLTGYRPIYPGGLDLQEAKDYVLKQVRTELRMDEDAYETYETNTPPCEPKTRALWHVRRVSLGQMEISLKGIPKITEVNI